MKNLPPALQPQPNNNDLNREMVTFYMRHDYKILLLKLSRHSPAGNMSAYLRYLVARDLYEAGLIDAHGQPVPGAKPLVAEPAPLPQDPPSFTHDEDEGVR